MDKNMLIRIESDTEDFSEVSEKGTPMPQYVPHKHFICHFPNKIGFFSSAFLQFFSNRIEIDKEQAAMLKQLQQKGIIIYVNKYKSHFDFLFYYTRYKQMMLPHPEIGFYYRILSWQPISRVLKVFFTTLFYLFKHFSLPDPFKTGYIKENLTAGAAGFLSLIDKKGFQRRFIKAKTDPILHLIEIQETTNQPVFIVPQLIFYSQNPLKAELTFTDILFGTEENPGKFRRFFTLLKNPQKIFAEISDPINLKALLATESMQNLSKEKQAFTLRRQLLSQLNRHRQSIIGPVLKNRVELKENILTNNRLQGFIAEHAEQEALPVKQVQKKASDYIEEIASNYSMTWIKVFDFSLRFILNALFEGMIIDEKGLAQVKKMSKKGRLILIPCHKSHLDYLIISYIFFHRNMPCPQIVAGKNLSFWPIGTIFKGGGAFFIRRSFKGKPLYKKVLTEYVYRILQEGYNIEVFIEGGRSRTGKLLMPKMGFISIIMDAFKKNACDDLIFVPISIGYDRVLEENAYIYEIEGGKKEDENLMQVIKARKTLKKRYGKVYVDFHDPISLKHYLQHHDIDLASLTKAEERKLNETLGFRFLNAINNVSVVTPHGIVAGAILNCSKKRFTKAQLMEYIDTYLSYISSVNVRMADTLAADPLRAIDQVLNTFVQRKFIELASSDKEIKLEDVHTIIKITENKRPSLDYYKNNSIAFFIPAAFTAFSILEKDTFLFTTPELYDTYRFLQAFFINEFTYDMDKTTEFYVRKTLKAFIDDGILIPHAKTPHTYHMTSTGLRKLKYFAHFLKTFFESYLIVLMFFVQYPKDAVDIKENTKKILSMGGRMYKKKEIERIEALSKINFKNAIDFYHKNGITSSEDTAKIEFYTNKINSYLNLLQ